MNTSTHTYNCKSQSEYQQCVVNKYCDKIWDSINIVFKNCDKILDIWGWNQESWLIWDRYRVDPQWWEESDKIFRGKLEEYDFWNQLFDGFFLSNTLYYLDIEKAIEKIKSLSKNWVFLSITDSEPGSMQDAWGDYIRPDYVTTSAEVSMEDFLNTVTFHLEENWFKNIKIRYIDSKVILYAKI